MNTKLFLISLIIFLSIYQCSTVGKSNTSEKDNKNIKETIPEWASKTIDGSKMTNNGEEYMVFVVVGEGDRKQWAKDDADLNARTKQAFLLKTNKLFSKARILKQEIIESLDGCRIYRLYGILSEDVEKKKR